MNEWTEKMIRIISKAVHMAQEENRRLGIPNVYVLNGKFVWQLLDGMVTSVNLNDRDELKNEVKVLGEGDRICPKGLFPWKFCLT